MEELYPAQLDGFHLEIETMDDTFEYAIVKHEIPNKNGAKLENMGGKAHPVNIRCYFWDHGDHQTYAVHIKLINHIAATAGKLLELIHPQYGRMKGMVERVTTRHDDRKMTAEVDITFVEDLRGTLEDVLYEEVGSAAEQAFIDGQGQQQQEVAADLAGEGFDLEQDLSAGTSIVAQLKGVLQATRALAKEVDGYLSLADSVASDIDQGFDSLVSAINYGVNLPGRVVGVLARTVERVARAYDALKTSPARYIKSLDLAFQNLDNKFAMFSGSTTSEGLKGRDFIRKHLKIASGLRLALEAASAYSEDEQKRQQVRRAEQTQSFDVNGRYIGVTVEPVLNARELDESLATVRVLLQEAVNEARAMHSLKTMATSLLDHVNIVKLERDRIMSITLESPLPLHLVCFMYGLPYQMAERIAGINSIPNPNFVSGTLDIYVRG